MMFLFIFNHFSGMKVDGRVTSVTSFGVFVRLANSEESSYTYCFICIFTSWVIIEEEEEQQYYT